MTKDKNNIRSSLRDYTIGDYVRDAKENWNRDPFVQTAKQALKQVADRRSTGQRGARSNQRTNTPVSQSNQRTNTPISRAKRVGGEGKPVTRAKPTR